MHYALANCHSQLLWASPPPTGMHRNSRVRINVFKISLQTATSAWQRRGLNPGAELYDLILSTGWNIQPTFFFFRWAQWSATCETWRVTCPGSWRTRTHNSTESTSRQPQTSPESRWPTTRRQHSWNNMCDVIQRPVHFKVLSSFNNLKVDFCKKL